MPVAETLHATERLHIRWLGRMEYADGLAMQEHIVATKAANAHEPDCVLLLEHDPVFTIGRTQDKSSLRDPAQLPAPLVTIGRGGQATWHGPGQLVGYPLLDLRQRGSDLHHYLRELEEVLIAFAGACGVKARRRDGFTGVWCGPRKLASIGVGVRRWITMHGFALNVAGSLDGFSHITPCGIADVEMTSLEREGALGFDVAKAASTLVPHLVQQFGARS